MTLLLAGLFLFLGLHTLRLWAPSWREARIAQWGLGRWRAAYGLCALASFALLVVGYGMARAQAPDLLWAPPHALRHVALLVLVPAMVLVASAYVPGNRIRARVGHPLLLGVALWAVAHLMANGSLPDVLLFSAFLAWAAVSFRAGRMRDRAAAVGASGGSGLRDAVAVVAGVALWALIAWWAHGWLIGVRPLQ